MLTITKKVEVSQQDIDDILCTAFEGGIDYWVSSIKKPYTKENREEFLAEKGAEYYHELVTRGCSIGIVSEDGDKLELTLENVAKGIQMFADKNPGHDLDPGNIDSIGADAIVQYSVFGELVYC